MKERKNVMSDTLSDHKREHLKKKTTKGKKEKCDNLVDKTREQNMKKRKTKEKKKSVITLLIVKKNSYEKASKRMMKKKRNI